MYVDFFDRSGNAIAYSEDEEHIYLFSGEAVSYLVSDAVYSYRGDQRGWYESGWIRDKIGRCIAFSEHATDGAEHAPAKAAPTKSERQSRPYKDPRYPRALRSTHSNAWSVHSGKEFFSDHPLRWPGGLGKNGSDN